DLFEDWYGKDGDAMQSFFAVVDRFSDYRSDVDVEELILKLYTFAMQNPYPEQWLDDMANVYAIGEQWDEKNSGWLSILKKAVKNQLMAVKDRKSTRLNSSHVSISYAVFCLKKKKRTQTTLRFNR